MAVLAVRVLYYLIIAFAIGTIAQLVTGYHKHRIFTTFIIGFVGVLAGDWFAHTLRLRHIIPPFYGVSLVWSIVGAVLFIMLFRLVRGRW